MAKFVLAFTRRIGQLCLSLQFNATMFVAIVCLSLAALDLQQSWMAHNAHLRQARTDNANLVASLAQYAHDAFSIADTMLLGSRDRYQSDGDDPDALSRVTRILRLRVASQPLAHGIYLFDSHGFQIANSSDELRPPRNDSDRNFFRWHRDHPEDVMLVSPAMPSRSDGVWIIPVTRRMYNPDKSFAGVIEVTIPVQYFQDYFAGFDIGKLGIVTLSNSAGLVMARIPADETKLGKPIGRTKPVIDFMDKAPFGAFENHGVINDTVRLGSFHRVAGLDLVVVLGRDKAEVLAPWWHQTMGHVVWLLVAMAAIALLGRRMTRQIRHRVKAEAMYRLLADNSSDAIVCLGMDGGWRYVSPSFCAMIGRSAAELETLAWADLVHPDDLAIPAAARAELTAGSAGAACVFRYMRPDASCVWVELRARLATTGVAEGIAFVANIRDITAQKDAELLLAEAHAQLEAMATTDGLTGIANRRKFDAVLMKEWTRAMRDGSSLALLMVDADCFKAYNDLYGHVLGDDCLKSIAGVLSGAVRRPGDLVARYGGEEFAVIMPGTSAHHAAQLANGMRLALAELAIPHRGNNARLMPDGGVVSISIGAAALVPQRGSQPGLLVEQADGALYHAKHTGRNRVRIARDAEPPNGADVVSRTAALLRAGDAPAAGANDAAERPRPHSSPPQRRASA